MSSNEKLICGDCKSKFEVETGKRGSSFVEFILWSTLVIPGFFYSMWRKRKPKKYCDYCGSTFLLPDNYETQAMLKPMGTKIGTEIGTEMEKKIDKPNITYKL
jgi:transposase-like protein